MYWVVQENIRDEAGYADFVKALEDCGIQHSIVKVIPFAHELVPDLDFENPVVAWGSTCLDMVAKKKGWSPGTFLNENFDQRLWTEQYGRENMLNGDAEFHEFGKIPPFEGCKFVRPVHDLKCFAGTVIDGAELVRWQQQILAIQDSYSTIRPDTPVSVSTLKDIETEFRFFVVDGKIVSGSMYRLGGRQRVDKCENWEKQAAWWLFAQSMVDKW